jgi:hypothetical protein
MSKSVSSIHDIDALQSLASADCENELCRFEFDFQHAVSVSTDRARFVGLLRGNAVWITNQDQAEYEYFINRFFDLNWIWLVCFSRHLGCHQVSLSRRLLRQSQPISQSTWISYSKAQIRARISVWFRRLYADVSKWIQVFFFLTRVHELHQQCPRFTSISSLVSRKHFSWCFVQSAWVSRVKVTQIT